MDDTVAFETLRTGEISLQKAVIADAVISGFSVSEINIYDPRKETLDEFVARQKAKEAAPEIRFMIQQKCPTTGKWFNSGFAIEEVAQSGGVKRRTRVGVGHFAM